MGAFRSGMLYGIVGFFAGFVFGSLRELILIPAFGSANGHLLEFLPLVIVIILLGIWITRRGAFSSVSQGLLCGIVAVCVLLVLESTLAVLILGQSVEQYLSGFNILDGKLFPFGLGIMALTPAIFLLACKKKK